MTDESLNERVIRVEEKAINTQTGLERLEARFDEHVLQVEFRPVKLIAFGMAGTILFVTLGAILTKILGL